MLHNAGLGNALPLQVLVAAVQQQQRNGMQYTCRHVYMLQHTSTKDRHYTQNPCAGSMKDRRLSNSWAINGRAAVAKQGLCAAWMVLFCCK